MIYQTIFENAITAYEENRLDEAESLSRQLLEVMPDNVQILKLLGMIAFDKELFEQAANLFFDILRIEENPEIILKLAQTLEAWGKPTEALEYYDKVLEKNPNETMVFYGRGMCYQSLGQKDKAKAEYEKSLELDEKNWQALLGLASIEDDDGASLRYLEKALLLSPENPFIMYQIALNNINQKDYKQALGLMLDVVKIYPHPKMCDTLGMVYDLLGDEENALLVYNEIVKSHPNYLPALCGKAEILIRNNKLDEAKAILKSVLEYDKNYLDALINIGSVAHKQGLLLEAIENYRKALAINPQIPEVLLNLAFILHEQENLDEAIGLYFNVLSIAPQTANLDKALYDAIIEYKEIDKENALKLAELWQKTTPESERVKSLIESWG